MCRSVDKVDAGGFAFGATGAGLIDDDGVEAAGAGDAAGFAAGAAVLGAAVVVGFVGSGFLENILCSLHIVSCIYWLTANSNFVVKMHTCASACIAHTTDLLTARHFLS